MRRNIIAYPAVLTPDENKSVDIQFVDFPWVLSFGGSIDEALLRGQDALQLAVPDIPVLPTPTPVNQVVEGEAQLVKLVSIRITGE